MAQWSMAYKLSKLPHTLRRRSTTRFAIPHQIQSRTIINASLKLSILQTPQCVGLLYANFFDSIWIKLICLKKSNFPIWRELDSWIRLLWECNRNLRMNHTPNNAESTPWELRYTQILSNKKGLSHEIHYWGSKINRIHRQESLRDHTSNFITSYYLSKRMIFICGAYIGAIYTIDGHDNMFVYSKWDNPFQLQGLRKQLVKNLQIS